MKVKKIDENEFFKIIENDKKALIDCYATWCGPCKMLSPVIDRIAEENDSCTFYKIDIDNAEEVASKYGIMSIPTLLLFEDGKLKETIIGLRSKKEIEELIK